MSNIITRYQVYGSSMNLGLPGKLVKVLTAQVFRDNGEVVIWVETDGSNTRDAIDIRIINNDMVPVGGYEYLATVQPHLYDVWHIYWRRA